MKMKQYIKLFPVLALTAAVAASCADDEILPFEVEKPESLVQYEAQYGYLNNYDAMKSYVDRQASPNFHLGLAIGANDFNDRGIVYQLVCENFDEMTAGNEMKYASIVNEEGEMNFATVEDFVETAKAAGVTIYGHTLAWHSQQNNTYLNNIIADKVLDVDPAEPIETEVKFVDYSTYTSFPFYEMGYTPEFEDGCMVSRYPGAWYQYFAADGISTVVGEEYKITAYIKGSSAGSLNVQFGNWGENDEGVSNLLEQSLNFTDDWSEVSINFTNCPIDNSFVVFQPGTYEGEIRIQWLRVSHVDRVSGIVTNEYLYQNDFSGTDHPGGWGNNSTFEIVEGAGPDGSAAMKIHNPSVVNSWEAQMAVDFTTPFTVGETYFVSYKIKGSASGNFSTGLQVTSNYASAGEFGSVAFTTDWQDVTLSCTCGTEGATRLIFSFGDFAGDIYIDDLSFYTQKSGNTEPLTPEEKKDTLTWAMNNWIAGMMEACEGYVTSWDAVNEAISGADGDGDGWYDLQSAENGDPANNFYWQDYLGNEDYVPIVTQAAVKYFAEYGGNPADLKLFINDYNLESWWDNNKKLESLIHWIEVWESKGAKIDGIGTQMHVSLILNENDQKAQEASIVRMFELMAATGKLVKISELDMGITEVAFGTGLKTEDVTYEQQQKMADFYQFIIQKYFEIIPPAQQYGITQWCATDSPADSGWRGGEPVGLWDLEYRRKPTYAGFANGLAGQVIVQPPYAAGETPDTPEEETPAE